MRQTIPETQVNDSRPYSPLIIEGFRLTDARYAAERKGKCPANLDIGEMDYDCQLLIGHKGKKHKAIDHDHPDSEIVITWEVVL